MGKTLAEYAAQNPMPEPQRTEVAPAQTYHDRQQQAEQIARYKELILKQAQAGAEPESTLYTAITAIGLLTDDAEWAEAAHGALNSVYADLAQQSLLTDNAAEAAHRLEQMQADYNDKMRRQLTRQLNGYKRLERALQEALQAVDATEQEEIL